MTGEARRGRLSAYAGATIKQYLPSPDAPTQAERQRKRLKLILQGHIAYLPTDAFLLWLYVKEAIAGPVFWSFIAAHVLINVAFVSLILTGLNRRLPDRSLGVYSIATGVLSNLAVLAMIGEYRAIYLVFCVTPFLSAAFKLTLRQRKGLCIVEMPVVFAFQSPTGCKKDFGRGSPRRSALTTNAKSADSKRSGHVDIRVRLRPSARKRSKSV